MNRRLLWARYRSYGICGRLFWALRAGYRGCTLKGRIGQFVSDLYKDEGAGVRQGDVDSSDGFALFIDDLDAEIEREEARVGRRLGIPLVGCADSATGDRINCLKHADDTVVVAASAEEAQHLLNAVTRWCCRWQHRRIAQSPCGASLGAPRAVRGRALASDSQLEYSSGNSSCQWYGLAAEAGQ